MTTLWGVHRIIYVCNNMESELIWVPLGRLQPRRIRIMSSQRPNKKGVDDFMDQGELVLLSNQTIPSYGTTHDATCNLIMSGNTP